jgi:geranylgeranyl diphosphate synthase type II
MDAAVDPMTRIERALTKAVAQCTLPGGPPKLGAAMHGAVFPKGARIRPRLLLAVAAACGEDSPALTDAAAASLELMHCASLVHDDLPCFDNADTRRGQPTVHLRFGEPLAVLAGDALIVLAFQTIVRASMRSPQRMANLLQPLSRAVGAPLGICAGQAWECEDKIDLAHYQQSKTGALFSAATVMGAAAAGQDAEPWRQLGELIGEAYQVADDLRDVVCTPEELGKPIGQDATHGRPNAVHLLGLAGAIQRLDMLAEAAAASVPECPGGDALAAHIMSETMRLLPKELSRRAA